MNGSMKGSYGDYKGTIGQKERFKDKRHDVYREREKWPEPTRCSECGAVFTAGRWTWGAAGAAPQEANVATCPACRRIADAYPAGIVELSGPFLAGHREEILHLIQHVEAAEKAEHPLERLMGIREEGGRMLVTTTGVHLARRIGDALARAYQGHVEMQYGDAEMSLRVSWER